MEHIRAGLYKVWEDSFYEERHYFDFFFTHGLPLGKQLYVGPDEAPYAALTLFPISFEQNGNIFPGFYLYALGTLASARGKGYGKALVTDAKKYALEAGRQFILLQPSNSGLFDYYLTLGFNHPVYQACLKLTRSNLSNIESNSRLQQHIMMLSAPLTKTSDTTAQQAQHKYPALNRFVWPPYFLDYVRQECIYRGGVVLDHTYCYPNTDIDGPFVEIKEFNTSFKHLPVLIDQILSAFPNSNRFYLYGKPPQKTKSQRISEHPFALVSFIHPDLDAKYSPKSSYFALGLD